MQQTLTLPYLRSSPNHIPRRDLVLSASDSLSLRVTVVEEDDPSAQLLTVTGGIGGPVARLVVMSDYGGRGPPWDYGRPVASPGTVLWRGEGTPIVGQGSFDFFVPFMSMAAFPPRCGWAVALSWDSGRKSQLLCSGALHLGGPSQSMDPLTGIFTDDWSWITTGDDEGIFT